MNKLKRLSPVRIIVLGFISLILIGTFILLLPLSHNDGVIITFIDALFMDWQPFFWQNYSEQEITFISVPILPVSECLTSYIPLVLNILKNHGF